MSHFVWSNNLNTGHAGIDADHLRLVNLINGLSDAIEAGHGREVIGQVLDDLIRYYRVHFQREETEMQRIGYAGYQEHKLEHDKFIQEVDTLKEDFDRGVTIHPVYVARMLQYWLSNHIVQVDMQLAATLSSTK